MTDERPSVTFDELLEHLKDLIQLAGHEGFEGFAGRLTASYNTMRFHRAEYSKRERAIVPADPDGELR